MNTYRCLAAFLQNFGHGASLADAERSLADMLGVSVALLQAWAAANSALEKADPPNDNATIKLVRDNPPTALQEAVIRALWCLTLTEGSHHAIRVMNLSSVDMSRALRRLLADHQFMD